MQRSRVTNTPQKMSKNRTPIFIDKLNRDRRPPLKKWTCFVNPKTINNWLFLTTHFFRLKPHFGWGTWEKPVEGGRPIPNQIGTRVSRRGKLWSGETKNGFPVVCRHYLRQWARPADVQLITYKGRFVTDKLQLWTRQIDFWQWNERIWRMVISGLRFSRRWLIYVKVVSRFLCSCQDLAKI